MKRYALAGALVLAIIVMLFHPFGSQRAIVQDSGTTIPRLGRPHGSVPTRIVVYVAGAVIRPGLYRLPPGARGVDAVRAAGGLTAQADPAGINLAELLEDGEQMTAPLVGQHVRSARGGVHRRKAKRHKRSSAPAIGSVDLNSADAQTLSGLPGIGDELARRIIAFREANGSFASLDELADVAGVTPRLIESLTPYVTIAR